MLHIPLQPPELYRPTNKQRHVMYKQPCIIAFLCIPEHFVSLRAGFHSPFSIHVDEFGPLSTNLGEQ